MLSETMMNDDFSPPLEESLRRKDSDQSWKPPSEGPEEEENHVDPNKLYLVSLATLMALFT
jgi:hypothetical protein